MRELELPTETATVWGGVVSWQWSTQLEVFLHRRVGAIARSFQTGDVLKRLRDELEAGEYGVRGTGLVR